MSTSNEFNIAVLPGDGIGVEVMNACLELLQPVQKRFGITLKQQLVPGGAHYFKDTGNPFPDSSMRSSEKADAVLFGAMGWPEIRFPDGTEIAPQLDIRVALDLYAGVRPVRALPGLPTPLSSPLASNIDMVIVRESTEGWFHSRGRGRVGVSESGDEAVYDSCEISRKGCERLFDFSFRLAQSRQARREARGLPARPAKVTCVDKSNVFLGMAFMNKVFRERAASFPGVIGDHCYIDAFCLNMVRKPWDYDVVPMENQFGDITSDLGAGLIGGMGYAPSGDVGDKHAMFQPSHGTAPDIAGKGKANPTAMILSAAMMLEWLGERHDNARLRDAALAIETAVDSVFAGQKIKPFDIGGRDGTQAITQACIGALKS
jgi:3-isopropylmalate dehydrogenase